VNDPIVIDVRMLRQSGIGTYIRNIVPVLIKLRPTHMFCLIGNKIDLDAFEWSREENVVVINSRAPIYSVSEQLALVGKAPRNAALFWSPHYNIPLFYRGKLLVTVHDVFHLANSHYVNGVHKRIYARYFFNTIRRKAARIICSSNFTASEFARLVGDAEIEVIYPGVSPDFFDIPREHSLFSRPYFLCVGNVKPHKNLGRLIKAFKKIEGDVPHLLVIVGQKDGFITGDPTVQEIIDRGPERIIFTGHVPDSLLRQYFVQSDALVFPSVYEGFGIPPLEAMACGIPVLASRIESVKEICKDSVLYMDPLDIDDISEKMRLVVHDTSLRSALVEHGASCVRTYNYESTAKKIADLMSQIIEDGASKR